MTASRGRKPWWSRRAAQASRGRCSTGGSFDGDPLKPLAQSSEVVKAPFIAVR